MDGIKLKKEFHQLIDSFDDIDVLESLYDAINELKMKKDKDILDDLNESQIKRLKESVQQANSGDIISHHEMRKKINKWLTQ